MGTPDWTGWLASIWGPSTDPFSPLAIVALASNVVVGNNPPYTVQDFLTFYPKFGGIPLLSGTAAPTGNITAGNQTVVVNNPAGIAAGQPIAAAGIADGTFVSSISGNNMNVSLPPTASGNNVVLTIWSAPALPVPVLLAFIALASASLVQARWLDSWIVAMGLFVAHFATLYVKSDGNPFSNPGQVAAAGLATGIQVSKSVGDVSVAYQPVQGLSEWGAWNLTTYGQQLATMAKIIGMGPLFLY